MNKRTLFILALVLVSAFAVHAIQFDHDHPHEFGDGLHAYFHGEDKKFWAVMVALVLAMAIQFEKFVFLKSVFVGYERRLAYNSTILFSPLIC